MSDSEQPVEWPGELRSETLLSALQIVIDANTVADFDADLERIRTAERGAEVLTQAIHIH